MSERKDKVLAFLISTLGAIIFVSTIIHILYTQIIPITEITAALLLMIPAAYIGLLNEEIKESLLSMLITTVCSIVISSLLRSMPALLGLFPHDSDVFIFEQVTRSVPLLFLLIPFLLIGTMIGVIINEFTLKSRY
ncbi:MAG: hypothetical protein ACFFFH_10005 [Candidatus Thorarchaeota archaeon]